MNSSSKYCALIVDDQKESTMVMATHYRLECQIVEKSVTDGPALRRYIFANMKSQQKEAVS